MESSKGPTQKKSKAHCHGSFVFVQNLFASFYFSSFPHVLLQLSVISWPGRTSNCHVDTGHDRTVRWPAAKVWWNLHPAAVIGSKHRPKSVEKPGN